ncbi:hypothetical protein GCM10025767_34510 [Thalassotalea piscium]
MFAVINGLTIDQGVKVFTCKPADKFFRKFPLLTMENNVFVNNVIAASNRMITNSGLDKDGGLIT